MSSFILEQIVNGIITGSMYALVAAGMTMIFGVLRAINFAHGEYYICLLYTSPSPRDGLLSRMPSSA